MTFLLDHRRRISLIKPNEFQFCYISSNFDSVYTKNEDNDYDIL